MPRLGRRRPSNPDGQGSRLLGEPSELLSAVSLGGSESRRTVTSTAVPARGA